MTLQAVQLTTPAETALFRTVALLTLIGFDQSGHSGPAYGN
jgi:hypothetical protein